MHIAHSHLQSSLVMQSSKCTVYTVHVDLLVSLTKYILA